MFQGLSHAWTFDPEYSAFATKEVEAKRQGMWTRAELQSQAQINIENLAQYNYFTEAYDTDNEKISFGKPEGYYLEYANQKLTLHFTLRPIKSKASITKLQIKDANNLVSFRAGHDGWLYFGNMIGSSCGEIRELQEHALQAKVSCR